MEAEDPAADDKPNAREGYPSADHALIVAECEFYRTAVEDAAHSDEPVWQAAATITACCDDGEKLFHNYSKTHPDYNETEAAEKFRRAREETGPRSCEAIERDLGFARCLDCAHRGFIKSPVQLGRTPHQYRPGKVGPYPIGYTKEGHYALQDPIRNIIILATANQLLSQQFLLGLAPREFWARQFRDREKLFDFMRAGEALIAACRRSGPFNPGRARGRGIWLEGDKIIVNLGEPVPKDAKNLYLCFEPIQLVESATFPTDRLLELLRKFKWRDPKDAKLFLGWLAIAPICGILQWRPHIYVYGPPKCGKTTIHTLTAKLLYPLVISTDGQSTEAGIRQTLGPDSIAIIIDEFESDQAHGRISSIIRLARSASSAENPVLRGTPEGKALQFSLRTTFFFSGVNPMGMSPADESRIVMLELMMHDNETDVAKQIIADELYFKALGPAWCSYMIAHAGLIPRATDVFENVMPSLDRRHRQNMATLLSGAFVALFGRVPTDVEASEWATEYRETIDRHAEALDRDDALECLDYLFSHTIEGHPLGQWVATAHSARNIAPDIHTDAAKRITQNFDIIFDLDEEPHRFLIRNGSPNVEKIFANTKWSQRGWMRAIKKLTDALSPPNPSYFPGLGGKSRSTSIPVRYLPDPLPAPGAREKY